MGQRHVLSFFLLVTDEASCMSLIYMYLSSTYRKYLPFLVMSSSFLFRAHIGHAFLGINSVFFPKECYQTFSYKEFHIKFKS